MATKDDQPPNSGLWGHVEVEALPNPGSLPPPPAEATPLQRGTLMGFAVPPAVANANATQPGPLRRTPNAGTLPARSNSKTLTSGVVPDLLLPPQSLDATSIPTTSPIGAIPKDTMLAPGGEPQPRGYYHASQATRTLIGGSAPPPANLTGPTGASGRRSTAPGFPTLLAPTAVASTTAVGNNTLLGVAAPPSLASTTASEHPTHRSPPSDAAVSTERDLRAVGGPGEGPSGPARMSVPPQVGAASHLGRFRIQKRLGAGGVGAVYLASKVDATGPGNQLLAVKVLREHFYREPSTLKALFREARLAARMDHRHIVRVFDIGYHNKHPYLVMEYVDGLSLATLLDHSPDLPLGVGIRCLIDALHGLDFAHKLRGDEAEPLGLVHCDVSPQNILVGVDGVAKVTDFGVARTREEDGDEFVLRSKPEYAAPELLLDEPVRPETDVFGAGAVLYRIATGQLPFPGETEQEVIDALRDTELLPPSQLNPDLPAFLDDFCAQAMARSATDRFRTCLDMARSLERQAEAAGLLADRLTVGGWVQRVRRAIEHGEVTVPPTRRTVPSVDEELNGAAPTQREVRSNKSILVGAALATVAVLGGALWWWLNWNDEQRKEERLRELGSATSSLTLTSDATPLTAPPNATSSLSTFAPATASTESLALAPRAAGTLEVPDVPSNQVTSKSTPPAPTTSSASNALRATAPAPATPRLAAPRTTPVSPSSVTPKSGIVSPAFDKAPEQSNGRAALSPASPPPSGMAPESPPPPPVGSRGF